MYFTLILLDEPAEETGDWTARSSSSAISNSSSKPTASASISSDAAASSSALCQGVAEPGISTVAGKVDGREAGLLGFISAVV